MLYTVCTCAYMHSVYTSNRRYIQPAATVVLCEVHYESIVPSRVTYSWYHELSILLYTYALVNWL